MDFDFEVEKNAFAGWFSCGAWINGEYFMIDNTLPGTYHGEPRPGFLRKGIISELIVIQRNLNYFCVLKDPLEIYPEK